MADSIILEKSGYSHRRHEEVLLQHCITHSCLLDNYSAADTLLAAEMASL